MRKKQFSSDLNAPALVTGVALVPRRAVRPHLAHTGDASGVDRPGS